MLELNKKELQLLHELECDCRQSVGSIAKKCRMSKENAYYHIKKLEASGVIRNYRLRLDFSRMGLIVARFYIKQKRLDPELEGGIINYLKSNKDVFAFGRASGEMDFAIGVCKKSVSELGDFSEELLSRFGDDIKWLQAHVMLEYFEYTHEYLTGEPKQAFPSVSSKPSARADLADLSLIELLFANARAPLSQIAKQAGLSERVARYRVRRMEREGVIAGFGCNIDYRKLGYDYYKIDLFLRDRAKIGAIRKFANSLPQTVYSERTLYYSDVEFDVHVKGMDGLLQTVQLISKKFPGAIREFKYYSMLEFFK